MAKRIVRPEDLSSDFLLDNVLKKIFVNTDDSTIQRNSNDELYVNTDSPEFDDFLKSGDNISELNNDAGYLTTLEMGNYVPKGRTLTLLPLSGINISTITYDLSANRSWNISIDSNYTGFNNYYTKTQIDTILNDYLKEIDLDADFNPSNGNLSIFDQDINLDGRYSLLGHNHSISDITGLQSALNDKEDILTKGDLIQGDNIIFTGSGTDSIIGSDLTISVDLTNIYTKSQLQTSGQSFVHWDNLTSKPALVLESRSINTGTGLTGGGNLSSDRTIEFDTVWGDGRYLQSFTELDPTVPTWVKAITALQISNWNTAFSWGDHATEGYIKIGDNISELVNDAGYITSFDNDYISNVTLSGENLIFTGSGGAFNGSISLAALHHSAVSIGTANGLSINATSQVLSLGLATTSVAGAMSSTDKTKLDGLSNYSHPTQTGIAITASGAEVITSVVVNTLGHTTAVSKRTLNLADLGYTAYVLPVATSSVLGGVIQGANVNISIDGTISVAAPYSHPTQTAISVTATDVEVMSAVAVNILGHVTSFTKRTLPTANGTTIGVLSAADWTTFNNKQAALVSGTNIKTINGVSLLGSGNLVVGGVNVKDEVGTSKWITSDSNPDIRFKGEGDTSVSFDSATRTVIINSTPGTGSGTGVVSFNGRVGGVSSAVGDYTISMMGDVSLTSLANDQILRYNLATGNWVNTTLTTSIVPEGTNLYFTQARARAAVSLTTTGNSGAATYNNGTGVFNIPNYTLAGLGGQPLNSILTSISGLATNVTGLVKLTNGVASIDNTVYASQSWVVSQNYAVISPSALTRTNDTNVTITLGGTPNTALLQAVSLTVGWTGTLGVTRGGTGAATLTGILVGNGTGAFTAVTGTANQVLRRNAANTAYEFYTLPAYLTSETDPIFTASAASGITSTNITNWNALVGHNHTLDSLSNVTIGTKATGNLLQWNGTAWVNVTPASLGFTSNTGTVTSIVAGNGLVNGTITTTGSIVLGTPSAITLSSTNSVTAQSHTHAFTPGGTAAQYITGAGALATFPTSMAPTAGSGNYIQNQYTVAQSAQAWISGSFRSGNVITAGYGAAGDALLYVGYSRTADASSVIDFFTDSTASASYNARVHRLPGANGAFSIEQKGTGTFYLTTLNSANVIIRTNGTDRMMVATNGDILIGSTTNSGLAKFQVTGAIQQTAVTGDKILKASTNGVIIAATNADLVSLLGDGNYVTTNTSQNNIGGNKIWIGQHSWVIPNYVTDYTSTNNGITFLKSLDAANGPTATGHYTGIQFSSDNNATYKHQLVVSTGDVWYIGRNGTNWSRVITRGWFNGTASQYVAADGSFRTGGTDFILNQNASVQGGNFWISGNGSIGSSLHVLRDATATGGGIFIGNNRSVDGQIDIQLKTSVASTSWDALIQRIVGENGSFNFIQKGTGAIILNHIGTGSVAIQRSGTNHFQMFGSNNIRIGGGSDNGFGKLQVAGNINQTAVTNAIVRADGNGTLIAASAADITSLLGTGNYIQNQNAVVQTGSFFISGDMNSRGNLYVGRNNSSTSATIKVGTGRTDSGYSYIDFIGDTTYTDYGLRIIRNNQGENATSNINHRGTGWFYLATQEAASIILRTNNIDRGRISDNGNWIIGSTTESGSGARLQVTGNIQQTSVTNQLLYANTNGVLVAATASDLTTILGTGNYVTVGGDQTGIGGNKTWTGIHTFLHSNTNIGTTGLSYYSLRIGNYAATAGQGNHIYFSNAAFDGARHAAISTNDDAGNHISSLWANATHARVRIGAQSYNLATENWTNSNFIQNQSAGPQSSSNAWVSGFLAAQGNVHVGRSASVPGVLYLGYGRTADATNNIYFYTDAANNTTPTAIIVRGAGANGIFQLINQGTGAFQLMSASTGPLDLLTNGSLSLRALGSSNIVLVGGLAAATGTANLQVNGAIRQTSVTNSLVKTDANGNIVAATAGTDYAAVSGSGNYIQNQLSSAQPSANFWIAGQGYFGSNVSIGRGVGSTDVVFNAGRNRSADGTIYLDLISSVTNNTGYDFRLERQAGVNGTGILTHKGTGALSITTENAANLDLRTNNTTRVQVTSTGYILMGTTTNTGNYRLQVDSGTDTGLGLRVRGTIFATHNIEAFSDIRKKSDICIFDKGLDIIRKVNSYEYTYSGERQYGIIANEFENLMPHMLGNVDGYLTVRHNQLHALTINAIKILDTEVEQLKKKVETLEKRVLELESSN